MCYVEVVRREKVAESNAASEAEVGSRVVVRVESSEMAEAAETTVQAAVWVGETEVEWEEFPGADAVTVEE